MDLINVNNFYFFLKKLKFINTVYNFDHKPIIFLASSAVAIGLSIFLAMPTTQSTKSAQLLA